MEIRGWDCISDFTKRGFFEIKIRHAFDSCSREENGANRKCEGERKPVRMAVGWEPLEGTSTANALYYATSFADRYVPYKLSSSGWCSTLAKSEIVCDVENNNSVTHFAMQASLAGEEKVPASGAVSSDTHPRTSAKSNCRRHSTFLNGSLRQADSGTSLILIGPRGERKRFGMKISSRLGFTCTRLSDF